MNPEEQRLMKLHRTGLSFIVGMNAMMQGLDNEILML